MHEPGSFEAASDALIQFGQAVLREQLSTSTCGNVSVRLDANRFVMSASGAAVGCLALDTLVIVALRDGVRLAGPKPSIEAELHRRAYLARPHVGAVLHSQSPYATLLACAENPPDDLDFIPEIPMYVRRFAQVPYAAPGSLALAESVTAAFADPEVTVVQMRNHGQVILGATWQDVVRRGVFFERACWMAQQPRPLALIPPEESAELRLKARDI